MKTLVTGGIALLTGAVITASVISLNGPSDSGSSMQKSADSSVTGRLDYLEQRLTEEKSLREELEETVAHERKLRMALANRISELNGLENALAGSIENQKQFSDSNRRLSLNTPNPDDQLNLLLDAGFSNYESEKIVEIETELQQKLLNAMLSDTRINARELALDSQSAIRQELGDSQYELYLETTGRPTSVRVSRVDEESAGNQAGILEGDEIISYDGERVFNVLDLREYTQSGTEGQTVIVELMRDGAPVTLAIPRGEIGISTGGFGGRRNNRND